MAAPIDPPKRYDLADMPLSRLIALIAGPVVAALIGFTMHAYGVPAAACWTAAVTALCAVWWITEPIPIPATSLLPLTILPLAGVITAKQAAAAFGDDIIMLFMGGFMLSQAMAKSGAHRRVAVTMVRWIGASSGRQLVLGFMVATAFLSMWMSNTATALMMLPVALAAVDHCEDKSIATSLLLGVGYAASIGGVGTPIGTPPNMVFMQQHETLVGEAYSFVEWMKFGVPVLLIMLPLTWLWLTRGKTSSPRFEAPVLPPIRFNEAAVLGFFTLAAVLWIFRDVPNGGWTALLGLAKDTVRDGTVALAIVCLLFIVPDRQGKGEHLLDWKTAGDIPWDILLLFGGGLALGVAVDQSGLSKLLAENLGGLAQLPPWLMIALLCVAVTALSEVASNTAAATMLMPIMYAVAKAANMEPAALMLPAALAASCGFMLPVATPPNAIVYGTGFIPVRRMARDGLVVDLIGVVTITVVCLLLL